jgi:hypothetical protein
MEALRLADFSSHSPARPPNLVGGGGGGGGGGQSRV